MKSFWLITLLSFSITGCSRKPDPQSTIPVATPTQVKVSEQSVEPKRIVWAGDDPADRIADDTKYEILSPGTYFGDGAYYGVKDGDIWLGLFKSGDQLTLRKSRVTVKVIRDRPPKPPMVKIVGKGQPVFWLKGPRFREGHVQGFFCPPPYPYEPEDKLGLVDEQFLQKYSIGGSEYIFRGDQAAKHSSFYGVDNEWRVPVLIIESQNDNQVVQATWLDLIADLDDDGKPDILVGAEAGDGIIAPTLYLSSEARPSKLLQAVALMYVSGD